MEIISSKSNTLIKTIKSLNEKKYREKHGCYFIEGEKCVLEATKFIPSKIRYIIITLQKASEFNEICNKFKTIYVSQDVFNHLSYTTTPQYIALVADYDFNKDFNFNKSFLVLDHLQDPGNLGTIIRTAVATGFNDIVLINSVDPYSPKVIRSSSSGIFSCNFYQMDYNKLRNKINNSNVKLMVAEAGKLDIFKDKFEIPNIYGLVIGSEGQGVSNDILSMNHISISLPMDSKMESLNAAVSASIIMYNLKFR